MDALGFDWYSRLSGFSFSNVFPNRIRFKGLGCFTTSPLWGIVHTFVFVQLSALDGLYYNQLSVLNFSDVVWPAKPLGCELRRKILLMLRNDVTWFEKLNGTFSSDWRTFLFCPGLQCQGRKLRVVVSIPVYKHDGRRHQMSELNLNFIEILLCFIWIVACKHHSRALGALENAMRGGFIRRLSGWSRMPF